MAVTIRRNRKRCSTLTRVFNVVTFVTFEFSSWFRGHWSSSYLTDRSRSTVPFIQLHGAAYENLRYVRSHLARSSCAGRYRDLIHHFSRAGGSKDREIHVVSAAPKLLFVSKISASILAIYRALPYTLFAFAFIRFLSTAVCIRLMRMKRFFEI